ncbi:prepilin-type N-terminal cleavage/methylation domain-containing protein [Paenisporosarcina antarctica]|uniref:Prepilin-type N-terminal cleavage/methylation domain-containing protein n=1 Tax=Paenisporosarcina antarctica TaxID=417367 RepID=A0A4P6ZWM5_9BACL|nr:prepilin-type N-terminal cleavage/methylation domain-containing protein [Paenisporosarcina antarctica]QBP40767.1 prepilin-type N-terminal cleavage/methylation domain-containing protein [Paenisporosarcina antarctica]
MRKFIQQKLKDQKGLTLIELLAVIVILAIIAAIAVPAISGIIQNSRVGAIKADAINIINAASLYNSDSPEIAQPSVTLAELKANGFIDDAGSFEDQTVEVFLEDLSITGKGILNAKIQVDFVRATKAEISEYANGRRTILTVTAGTDPVTPLRSIIASIAN